MKYYFKNYLTIDNEIDQKYLNSMLYNFRQLIEKCDILSKVNKKSPYAIINYLKTNDINNENYLKYKDIITLDQYQKINEKKVNKIYKLALNTIFKDCNSKQTNKLFELCVKLYLILGFDNTIELFNGKYGITNFDKLSSIFGKCSVKKVDFDKVNDSYEPVLNKYITNFLIGDKKDDNSTIRKLLRGDLFDLEFNFEYFYNSIDIIQSKIGKIIHLNKLLPLLKGNIFILRPNEYKLTNDLLNDFIMGYRYLDQGIDVVEKNNTIVLDAEEFYQENLLKRIKSSIPRVKGITKDNYSYEVLRLDDPQILTLGYLTGCCFRTNGQSKEFLKYCSSNAHGRVIVIKNENNEICAMTPIIRNGNVVVGNSIEINNKGDHKKIYNALSCSYDDIIKVSNENEEKPIIACLLTDLHGIRFSYRYVKKNIHPISNEEFYTNYNMSQYIISSKEDISEEDFELFVPEDIYFDERPQILTLKRYNKNNQDKNEIKNRINSINYNKGIDNKEINILYFIDFYQYIICNEDWYLILDYDKVIGECLDKDPRATIEYNIAKEMLEEVINEQKLDVNEEITSEINKRIKKIEFKK